MLSETQKKKSVNKKACQYCISNTHKPLFSNSHQSIYSDLPQLFCYHEYSYEHVKELREETVFHEKNTESDEETQAFERGKIAGLQEAILAMMEKNGPVTDQMRRDVMENVYHDSLINWVKSFR